MPLEAENNLITRVALYVLRCHDHHEFPVPIHVHITNPIPLGRGLGSSGAAVTAGVVLGHEVGQLGLDKPRMLDYCLMIGRSPTSSCEREAINRMDNQNDTQTMLLQRCTVASSGRT